MQTEFAGGGGGEGRRAGAAGRRLLPGGRAAVRVAACQRAARLRARPMARL